MQKASAYLRKVPRALFLACLASAALLCRPKHPAGRRRIRTAENLLIEGQGAVVRSVPLRPTETWKQPFRQGFRAVCDKPQKSGNVEKQQPLRASEKRADRLGHCVNNYSPTETHGPDKKVVGTVALRNTRDGATTGASVSTSAARTTVRAKPVSTGPVRVSGRQLLVGSPGEPYQIRGVGYQPTPVGQQPGNYNCYQQALWGRDLPLLRRMGCNTLRTWGKINNDDGFLDACWNGGAEPIRVVAGFWINPASDFEDPAVRSAILDDFKAYVAAYKNHPAILIWLPGGEINYALKDNPPQLKAWFTLLDELGWGAYQVEGETYHPVTTDLAADVWNGPTYLTDLAVMHIGSAELLTDDSHMTGLDVWGINSYRGSTFDGPARRGRSNLFADYAALSSKPMWLSEYGADAWDHGAGEEAERAQADQDRGLWDLIAASVEVCRGGSVMAYSDEWWKNGQAGNWTTHDPGPWQRGDQPDGWTDEEYYGIVRLAPDGTVEPRLAYYALGLAWGLQLHDLVDGWNLISVPGISQQTILDLIGQCEPEPVFVWDSDAGTYRNADVRLPFEPQMGYWICATVPDSPVRMQGTLATGTVHLKVGWNLVGPLGNCAIPDDNRLVGCLWWWDPATQTYRALTPGERLVSGRAYWVFSLAEFDLPLQP